MTHQAEKRLSEIRSLESELMDLEQRLELGESVYAEIRAVKDELENDQVCETCDGDGEVIAHHKINSTSIDVPYEKCSTCGGVGVI